MKILREMCLSILIVLFLISGVTYAQSPAEVSYDKGVEHAVQGKFRKAKEEFKKALKIDPFYIPTELSLEIIKDVIEQKIKTETAILLFKGVSNANKCEYDQAISDYTKAIEINPKYADAYYNRGLAYYKKGQNDRAISDYNKVIEINPKYADVHNNRGNAYDKKGQNNRAISDYNKAIEINPKDAIAYYNRGLAYDNKGQYDRTISDYTKAIEINPKNAKAYSNRGVAYDNKGQYDRAISDSTKAIEINPKYAIAYDSRGFVYLVKLGNKVKGCANWKKACELGRCGNYNLAKQKGYCL